MSEPQAQTENTVDSNPKQLDSSPSFLAEMMTNISQTLKSWKFKLGLVILGFFGIALLIFYWSHFVSILGLRGWSASSGAEPISCMIKDTNNDEYISCSALLDEQVVPLECGASIFNIGCRINYGAAAPNIRVKPKIKL